ncbi:pilus assembly PilX family protein [Nitrospina watsonii]|uniref:Type 4 fimbrial biogenesis protein PilX N-terminal domain-containing protein n=1 Tax=Nitrospina watsonii TaxID=1323948 RepID=A0ABM9HF87_9BACT|nr:PilX N-terminal domain-containing pilus assembly protein [Nitrospina watsonii]CAI2718828.1 conserved protein of unknown function [Nitrospina watsonii]
MRPQTDMEIKILKDNSLRFRSLDNESGLTMVMVLLFLVMLAALAPIAVQKTVLDTKMTANFKTDKQLFFIADAGVQDAMNAIFTTNSNDLDDELTTNSGVIRNNIAFGGGNYTVTVTDNNDGDGNLNDDTDNVVYLTSVGTRNGETKTVRMLLRATLDTWLSPGAVISDGTLMISGNPDLVGTEGSVHANINLEISGSPTISKDATASGSLSISGSPSISGVQDAGVANLTVPTAVPLDYKMDADFILDATGKVYSTSTDPPTLIDGDGSWNGWDYVGSGRWVVSGSTAPPDGMYYVDGDVNISGNPGTTANPWATSIVTEGHIEISGNPAFSNYKDPNAAEGIQNLLFVAGTDLKINGNPGQTYEGVMYAGEQASFAGNPDVNGVLMIQNNASSDGLVSENNISGNPTITYNGSLSTPFATGGMELTTLAWQEM